MTMFCPKCGSLLKPKTEKKKKVLACSCGYSTKDLESAEIKETVKQEEKKLDVVDEKQTPSVLSAAMRERTTGPSR